MSSLSTPQAPAAPPPRLLDWVRDAIRVKCYSMRIEEAYVQWIRRFMCFTESGILKNWAGMRLGRFGKIAEKLRGKIGVRVLFLVRGRSQRSKKYSDPNFFWQFSLADQRRRSDSPGAVRCISLFGGFTVL